MMRAKMKPTVRNLLRFAVVVGLAFCTTSCEQAKPLAKSIPIPERAHGGFDLATGLYTRSTADLALTGNPPLVLAHVYRNRDDQSRPFGIGTSDDYDEFLVGEYPKWIGVVLDAGATIHYARRPGGKMIFDNTDRAPGYVNSTIQESFLGQYWYLERTDGVQMTFLSCNASSRALQCGLIAIRDAHGNAINIRRDFKGNARRIANDIGWIDLDYDRSNRVTAATASSGESVHYFYDAPGRLAGVQYSTGGEMRYEYDDHNNMTKIIEPRVQLINTYDEKGYGIEQQGSTGRHFLFTYDIDKDGKTISTKTTRFDLHSTAPIVTIDYFDKDRMINKEVLEPDTDHVTTAILAREPDTGEPHVVSGLCKLASGELSLRQPTRRPSGTEEIEDLKQQCQRMAAARTTRSKPQQ
jgi:YD repeat-containing protein